MKTSHWYDRLYIWPIIYFSLGFFNILFAWLGMIDFLLPLLIAIFYGNKAFCNRFCGRGQLFALLGGKLNLSSGKPTPKIFVSSIFRHGFLIFFLAMFGSLLWRTWLVASGAGSLDAAISLLWSFSVPWAFACPPDVAPWIIQFSLGFYSLMLTSTIVGLAAMALWKPRSWCVFCPMGTMTQGICRIKNND